MPSKTLWNPSIGQRTIPPTIGSVCLCWEGPGLQITVGGHPPVASSLSRVVNLWGEGSLVHAVHALYIPLRINNWIAVCVW